MRIHLIIIVVCSVSIGLCSDIVLKDINQKVEYIPWALVLAVLAASIFMGIASAIAIGRMYGKD